MLRQLINKQNMELVPIEPLTAVQKSSSIITILKVASAGRLCRHWQNVYSLYKAFDEILRGDKDYRRIVIVRSAVATRDIGHLPGTLEEKSLVYEMPYIGYATSYLVVVMLMGYLKSME